MSSVPVFRRIDADKLLPPLNPSRETFDEQGLADLVASIQELGILEPLIVEQEGTLYRIHAGHRRFIAGQAVKLATFPCMAYAPGTAPGSAIQHHENKIREDLNAAEEARHFGRILEQECGGDVDVLCLRVVETRPYVEGRLALLSGWPQTLEALGAGFINIGVAMELNRITDEPSMLMYLDAAARGGATVRTVREWRTQWERTQQFQQPELLDRPLAGAAVHVEPTSTMTCFLCDSSESPHDMELLFSHKTCRRLLLDNFLAKIRGEV